MSKEKELIHRLMDGELPAEERESALKRLDAHPCLKQTYVELFETVSMLESSQAPAPPPRFTAEVMQALPERTVPVLRRVRGFFFEQRVLRWNVAVLTAFLVMIAALGVALLQTGGGDGNMAPVAEVRTPTVVVQFRFYAPEAKSVALVGEFNKWMLNATKLARRDGGYWAVEVPLEPGMYTYMFVVNGTDWIPDPGADAYRDDGFGYQNSVRRVYSL